MSAGRFAMLLRGWILICSVTVMAGWILSSFSAITGFSYLLLMLLLVGCWMRWELPKIGASRKIARRTIRRLLSWRLLLPGLFGVSALLLLIKGFCTDPCHDDGLCYRIPRVMNWIMEHRWHWIAAQDVRLNTRGTVSEWLTVPILLFLKNDRFVFLPNWISHLFLPGLIFSVWRNLGVLPRMAWMGMWLIPTGYCFALQAVNSSNDSIGAFFLLAAFHYALKPGGTRSWGDVALSTLSIALASGVKLNLLPFIFPWAVAISPGWRVLLQHPARTALLAPAALLVSFFPNGLMNWLHGAGFSGLKLEPVFIQPPLYAAYLGNFFLIMAHNLAEAPWTLSNDFVSFFVNVQHSAMGSLLGRYFQPAAFAFYPWIAVEEAGLGLWVVISLFFMLASSIPLRDGRALSLFSGGISRPWIIALGLWVIFFFYMLLANSNQPARLICPFYVLLVPTLLKGRIFRSNRFWRYARVITAMTMMLGLLSDLTLTENPLIALHSWQNARRQSDLDAQGLAQQHLPSGEKAVGCIRAWNERESWLWHPYGTRKVVELPYHPDLEQMNHAGIRYLFISSAMLQLNQQTIESWSEANHFQIIAPLPPEPSNWYLVKAIQTPSRV